MPKTRLLSIATAVCLAPALAAAGVARASPPPRADPPVLVWPEDAEDDISEVESTLDAMGYLVVPFGPLAERLKAGRATQRKRTEATLAELEEGLLRAQDLYLAQRWDPMLAELEALQENGLSVLARTEGCGTLWEIEFRLGLGHGARRGEGDVAARTEHFAMALALDGARRPLGELYGPDVAASFLAAVDVATARMPRSTVVVATPDDARVTIDCKVVEAGQEVPLVPGRHALLVEAPGHRPFADVIMIAPGDPITVTLPRDDTDDPVLRLAHTWSSPRLLPTGPASQAAIAAVADYAGATRWIVLAPTKAGARAELWSDGARRRVAEHARAATAAVQVLAPVRPKVVVGPPITVPTPPRGQTDAKKPLVRTWWFWTAIVGGVAVTGLGLGLGLGLRDRSSDRLQVVVQ